MNLPRSPVVPEDAAPIPGRLLRGTSWLALQIPLQILFALGSLRLILGAIGPAGLGAYRFAFGFGVIQALADAGAGSAVQRQLATAWARGDRVAFDRALAVGLAFAAATAALQQAAFLGVAALAVPHAGFSGDERQFVVGLLWLQALAAPFFGVAMVTSGVMQATRRYGFVAGWELAITVLRFGILVAGIAAGAAFFWVVAAQVSAVLTLRLAPALRVLIRELGGVPRLRAVRRSDVRSLGCFGLLVVLIQAGVLIGDKVDVAVLGFVCADPGPEIALYDVVSKPYLLLRQAGAMLAAMVMPAVAGLVAAGDGGALDRIKYDGLRLHAGVLLPVGLLAWLEAGPFLALWFGGALGYDASVAAPLMRLLLVATLPTLLAIPVQAAIGLGKIRVLAVASLAGAVINLPLSCLLAWRLGVSGVIWGTVLTTLIADVLVPALHLGRLLALEPRILLRRAVWPPLAGGIALVAIVWGMRRFLPVPVGVGVGDLMPAMMLHVGAGVLAFLAGYALAPAGRGDLGTLLTRRGRRPGPDAGPPG